MAAVDVMEGAKLLIRIGDAGDPETFAHDCLINTSRGVSFSATATETEVPDCDDPAAPADIRRKVRSRSATITGAGLYHQPSGATWFNWYRSGEAKTCQVYENVPGGNVWQGSFILTQLDIQGDDRQEMVRATITLMSDGAVELVE